MGTINDLIYSFAKKEGKPRILEVPPFNLKKGEIIEKKISCPSEFDLDRLFVAGSKKGLFGVVVYRDDMRIENFLFSADSEMREFIAVEKSRFFVKARECLILQFKNNFPESVDFDVLKTEIVVRVYA
jgi:hypothetical protein